MNTKRFMQFCLLLPAFLVSTYTFSSTSRWEFQTFSSGSLKHWIAAAGESPSNKELEVFCSNHDPRTTLALYLPDQRFLKRDVIEIEISIDQRRTWKLAALRNAMAITTTHTPEALLNQLARGNKVQISYSGKKNESFSETFSLRRSAKALSDMKRHCRS